MKKKHSIFLFTLLFAITGWAQGQLQPFNDDVESHTDFEQNNIVGWTSLDLDGLNTNGPFQSFPGKGGPLGFIVYNPTQTTPPNVLEGYTPRSGNKYFASVSSYDGPVNDWLISDELVAHQGGVLTFYAKMTVDFAGDDEFKVGYSTTGSAPQDFTFFGGGATTTPPLNWTKYEYIVPAGVKHLAINCVSQAFMMLIDDIQFFAGKERSQEEFFHTFNSLLEGGRQIILTCDRFPKEINGLEERLKSRFGWGLTVAVEPPELETRVAILMKKAEQSKVRLSSEAAFFIAQKIRSNVRELEGALRLVIANAHFTGSEITPPFIRESLKDLLALHEKQVSMDNIQRTVAEYYKIKVSDLLSKRRTRTVTRPRQMAMALSKELTNHSLPEIGDAFGGRDHTTVLHACKKIVELQESDPGIREDYQNFMRLLTS